MLGVHSWFERRPDIERTRDKYIPNPGTRAFSCGRVILTARTTTSTGSILGGHARYIMMIDNFSWHYMYSQNHSKPSIHLIELAWTHTVSWLWHNNTDGCDTTTRILTPLIRDSLTHWDKKALVWEPLCMTTCETVMWSGTWGLSRTGVSRGNRPIVVPLACDCVILWYSMTF